MIIHLDVPDEMLTELKSWVKCEATKLEELEYLEHEGEPVYRLIFTRNLASSVAAEHWIAQHMQEKVAE